MKKEKIRIMEVYLNLELEDIVINDEVEVWKKVNSIDGLEMFKEWYWVSSFGRVKSVGGRKDKILKQCDNGREYLQVGLQMLDGKPKFMLAHRLVCLAFVDGYSKERNQSNHINEIKTDNRASNLNWMSAKQNVNYGTRNERVAEKLSTPVIGTCIKTDEVIEFDSTQEAGRCGFDQSAVSSCCNGNRKTHKGFRWRFKESA